MIFLGLITIALQILISPSSVIAQSLTVAELSTIIQSTTENNTFIIPNPNDTIVTVAEFNLSTCDVPTSVPPCGVLTRWLGDFNDNTTLSLTVPFNESMPLCRANVSIVNMVWRESESDQSVSADVEAIAVFGNSTQIDANISMLCESMNFTFMIDATGCATNFSFPGLQTARSECVNRFVPTTATIQTSSSSSLSSTFDDTGTFPPTQTSCPRGLFGPKCDNACMCNDEEKPLCNDGIAGDGSCRAIDVLENPVNGVHFLWILGMLGGGALGVGLAWHRDPKFMRESVFGEMPRGWLAWLTHPMTAIVVVVFSMTYQMLSQVFATAAIWARGLALVVSSGGANVRWLSTVMAPLLSIAALTGKVYALLACAMLESNLQLYYDDDVGNRPIYRGGGCFAWTRERWKIAILKVAFVVADFLMIGLAPMATLAQFDWFMNMIHGDLEAVVMATNFSEYTLYGVGIASGVILLMSVASCTRWGWDKETRNDPNFDCGANCKESFYGLVTCQVLLCLICLGIFTVAGIVWSFWQFKEIDDLIANGVTLPESFWGAFTLKTIVITLDLAVTVLALAGQIGKRLPTPNAKVQLAAGVAGEAAPEMAENGQVPVAAVVDEVNDHVQGAAEDNVLQAGRRQQRRQNNQGN